jgi:LysM repeat protein
MKKYCLFILAFLIGLTALAQQKLLIKGKGNSMYIEHKVGEKESLSSVGRMYGITASQLARFNGKSPSSLLSNGSTIKVPLKLQDIQSSSNGTSLYHVVGKGDNLFKIAQTYNKVPLTLVKKWNKLSNNAVKNGQQIIVGYLKINDEQVAASKTVLPDNNMPGKNTEMLTVPEKSVTPVTEPVKKAEIKTETPNTVVDTKKDAIAPASQQGPDEGFFASLYMKNDLTLVQKSFSGSASTFKTISGWTDRKYYVLINDITPGTIVRITASNDKSICARVLGPLPETKGAEGLLLRMSNSAASVLDMKDQQFTVTLTYFE